MPKISKRDQQAAIDKLRELLHPGDTVYTVLRSVAPSGMSRCLDAYIMRDNEPIRLTGLMYRASGGLMGWDNRTESLRVYGCGSDAGFEAVYMTARRLWPEGFTCVGEGCPANDHHNGDRDYTPHQHRDGGYALNHRWMR